MIALITKILQKNLLGLGVYTAISSGFIWMYVAIYPSIAKESEKLKESFEAFPKEFFQAFDIDIASFVSSFEGFISGEYFSILWPMILVVLIIAYAGSAIAGEIEKGTIELLLAQPLSRLKIFLSKYIAGLIFVLAYILLSNFSVVPFSLLHGVDLQLANYLTISVIGFSFALAVFGLCLFISSAVSSKGLPMAITGGTMIIMYALDIFSSLRPSLDKIKYVSFFHYYDYKSALLENRIDLTDLLVLVGVALIFTIGAAWVFLKRDISTS